jgi:cation diffusion facilitator CzcD-associated flavoprotein CzcO
VDVAIIGAGPYGLSLAAHLKALRVDFRIFGSPMHTWLTQMPKGMRLKSEGFASSLYDPDTNFTLADYCQSRGLPYADTGLPVPLETFASYGLEFQRRFVPEVENRLAVALRRRNGLFEIVFADGVVVHARKVVVAVGITHFGYVPPVLSDLPEELVTHSSRHSTLDHFKGREVAIVGAGASALDLAALLHQAGASVHVIARKPVIRFHDPPNPGPRPPLQRMRFPMTGIGTGWKLVFYANAPGVFHHLPERFRLEAVRRTLGPAPAWFIKDQVADKVTFHLATNVTRVQPRGGRIELALADAAGCSRTLVSDHVIAATGYKVDLGRLTFLDPEIQNGVQSVERTPVLSARFESSVSGLHFVGTAAANSFGPVLRFAFGAGFTARVLSRHLESSTVRGFAHGPASPAVQAFERS